MKSFFKELLQYNTHYNQALLTVLTEQPEMATEKCLKLLSHILNVHQIWNLKVQQEQASVDPWAIYEIGTMKEMDQNNFVLSNRILEVYELNQAIEWTTKGGQSFRNSIQDILFQIINHSTYHRAQIATEFRQGGLEPLLTDYIYYKMINQQ